jgi:hypothetical protein
MRKIKQRDKPTQPMTRILETSVTTTHLIDDVMRCLTFDFVFHVELQACLLQGNLFLKCVRHTVFPPSYLYAT